MPAKIQDVVNSANTEWNRWGNAVWNTVTNHINSGFHTDDEDPFAAFVRDNYCALVIKNAADRPTKTRISKDKYFRSAVGMSFILNQAGYTKSEFKFSEAHRTYIRQAIKARQNNDTSAPFWGFRINEAGSAPAVGDLIGYARGDGVSHKKAQAFFDDMTTRYGSHYGRRRGDAPRRNRRHRRQCPGFGDEENRQGRADRTVDRYRSSLVCRHKAALSARRAARCQCQIAGGPRGTLSRQNLRDDAGGDPVRRGARMLHRSAGRGWRIVA